MSRHEGVSCDSCLKVSELKLLDTILIFNIKDNTFQWKEIKINVQFLFRAIFVGDDTSAWYVMIMTFVQRAMNLVQRLLSTLQIMQCSVY